MVSLALALGIATPTHAHIERAVSVDLLRSSFEHATNLVLLSRWREMHRQALRMPSDHQKLISVDNFFNQNLRYAPDSEIYGVDDHWATPLEFLSKGVGDCEDFAIAKYLTLVLLGVPQEKLRLDYVFVRSAGTTLGHVVVTYSDNGTVVVLDGANVKVNGASEFKPAAYIFSFNLSGVSIHGRLTPARYSQWEDLLARVRQQSAKGLAGTG